MSERSRWELSADAAVDHICRLVWGQLGSAPPPLRMIRFIKMHCFRLSLFPRLETGGRVSGEQGEGEGPSGVLTAARRK